MKEKTIVRAEISIECSRIAIGFLNRFDLNDPLFTLRFAPDEAKGSDHDEIKPLVDSGVLIELAPKWYRLTDYGRRLIPNICSVVTTKEAVM